LGHPCKFQRVSRLGRVTAQHSSSGRQPNFAALNRGCHLPIRQGGHHVGHWPTFLVESTVAIYLTAVVATAVVHVIRTHCR